MPPELTELVRPARTALVTHECQGGVIGAQAALPELAEAAAPQVVPNAARLTELARAAGVQVVHCLASRRADGVGTNRNAPLFGAMRRSGVELLPGSAAASVVPEIRVDERDLVVDRLFGLSGMSHTGLDQTLRNLDVSTVVVTGVSLNIGIPNFVMDAVNAAYQVVVVEDAVVGVPRPYGEQVLRHTLAPLATLATTDDLAAIWGGPPTPSERGAVVAGG